jgi:hypothetical protein
MDLGTAKSLRLMTDEYLLEASKEEERALALGPL